MEGGIYIIQDKVNGNTYVGSTINFKQRLKQHKTNLNCGRHPNQKLQRAWNKYGADNFIINPIEYTEDTSKENLHKLEQKWFDYFKDAGKEMYNTRVVVESTRGLTHTEEARKKISENSRRFMNLPENRELYRNLMLVRMSDPELVRQATSHFEKEWPDVYDPDGNRHVVGRGLKEFCRQHGLVYQNMLNLYRGNQPYHKGWRLNPSIEYRIIEKAPYRKRQKKEEEVI